MAGWSEYQAKGIWGLCSSVYPSGFDLGIRYEQFSLFFPHDGQVQSVESLPPGFVFEWESAAGFRFCLYAGAAPAAQDASLWQILLEHEVLRFDGFPTFLPFLPGLAGLARQLNELLSSPPAVLVLNGQSGTGKQAVLQALALRYAGVRIDSRDEVAIQIQSPSVAAIVVPEVALLEVPEQQAALKHIKSGGQLWAATVYDLQALRNRKILQAPLADALIPARFLLPALAKRSPAELEEMAAFWRAFYGTNTLGTEANLDFQKSRALGKNSLSVESILEEGRGLRGVIAEFEKQAILKAQARVGRSQHKIANLLKVSRGSLQHKLRKYQLESYASADADTDNEHEV
jgi:hypothetical protein